MLALVQRVKKASVLVEAKLVSQIDAGLLVLLGILDNDTKKDADYIADKLLNLRVFPSKDGEKEFELSVKDIGGEILLVSQFTLAADCKKGRRPSFSRAMNLNLAEPVYQYTATLLAKEIATQTGVFGAHMEVGLVNDGPVTLLIDSQRR